MMIKNSPIHNSVRFLFAMLFASVVMAQSITTAQMTKALRSVYDQAVEFSKSVESYPDDSREKVTITRMINMLKQDARKLKVLSQNENTPETQAEFRKMAGRWKEIRNAIQEMEKEVSKKPVEKPKTPDDIQREIDAYQQRIKALESRLDAMPVPVDRLSERQRVEQAIKAKDWITVRQRLDKALVHYPDDSELHYYLALYNMERKDYPGARDAILEALRLNPRQSRYWELSGKIYMSLGLFEQAFGAYAEILLLDPRNTTARIDLAKLMFESGRIDSAETLYRELISLRPDSPEGYEGLGRVEWHKGNDERAKTYYQNAITRNSTSPELYLMLGQIYMDQKQYRYAIRHFEQVIRLDPDQTDVRFLLGKAYWHTYDFARATVYWSQVYRQNNRAHNISFWLPAAYYVQGEILQNQRLYRESARSMKNALEINPDSYHWMSWGNYWLGKYYQDQDNPPMAEKYYVRALETNPNLTEALNAMGILRWHQNRMREARRYWQRALEIDPSNHEAIAWLKIAGNTP